MMVGKHLLRKIERRQPPTKGFVQLEHDVETIIGDAYPSFIFGGRNSAGQ